MGRVYGSQERIVNESSRVKKCVVFAFVLRSLISLKVATVYYLVLIYSAFSPLLNIFACLRQVLHIIIRSSNNNIPLSI